MEAFFRKRDRFFGAGIFREAEYGGLERLGNLLLDVERAQATGEPLRAPPKSPFPSRQATVRVPAPDRADQATLEREMAAARAAEADFSAMLERLYGYDLLRRNCVTELFAVINDALTGQLAAEQGGEGAPAGEPDAALQAESRQRLGGFIDPGRGLTFIPVVSVGSVEENYAVAARRDRLSYRSARLAEMKAREGAVKVFLRESNTVTSTVYRRGPGDSAFLFFTDDALLLRPVFGAFNLLAGAGEGLLGLLTLPVEGPERLVSGARGVVFSLPELLFFNLRKGSMAYVEQSGGEQKLPR